MRRCLKLFLVLLLSAVAAPAAIAGAKARTVIVVMFDGFSPAMKIGVATPHFDKMEREGVISRHLVPSFPTLSMTNHTTFQTGCWPEKHGIVSNIFIDPKRGLYGPDRADAVWREGCESMWQAAERQGAHAAVFNFVGRWSSEGGAQASIINEEVPWSQHEDDDTIIAKAIKALKRGDVRLIALYFDYPDSVAHGAGVHGEKTRAAVARADAVLGRLMAAMAALPKTRAVSLVVAADHGMTGVKNIVNIGKLKTLHGFEADVSYGSGSAMLYLKPGGDAARVQAALAQYSAVFQTYRKGEFPPYAHIGTGPRVGDLLLVTRPPYAFWGPEILREPFKSLPENTEGPAIYEPAQKWFDSMHGYTPDVIDMHAIFYAWGDGVAHKELPRIEMIDVAPTVLHLLGLQPGKDTDGKAVALGE